MNNDVHKSMLEDVQFISCDRLRTIYWKMTMFNKNSAQVMDNFLNENLLIVGLCKRMLLNIFRSSKLRDEMQSSHC